MNYSPKFLIMNTREIIEDSKNLPVDIMEFKWVSYIDYYRLKTSLESCRAETRIVRKALEQELKISREKNG
jgi:hypothetical protein